jgi:ribosomal protein S18 acetylase RimI-like enzyme
MLKGTAPRQILGTVPQSVYSGAESHCVSIWRERCLLWQKRDLQRALAHFTFIADVTTLAAACRFAGDSDTLVARYDGLPFAAIAFHSQCAATGRLDTPGRIAKLTQRLISPGEPFYCLVADGELALLEAAYQVSEVHPEQQMLYSGNPSGLNPGDAARLTAADVPAMAALAQREGMMAFEEDPLARGPWYGVRRAGRLVAQGGIHLLLDRAAELGNIVTARSHRRQGLGTQILAALLRELMPTGRSVFLQVFEDNAPAISFYQTMGFRTLRPMVLAQCRM